MRPTTVFIIFSIGALGFLAYIGKEYGVKTPTMSDLKIPEIKLPAIKGSTGQQGESEDVTVYKWQDSNGRWYYGDTPPAGTNAIAVTVSKNQNLVPGFIPEAELNEDTEEESGVLNPASNLPASYQEAAKMLGIKLPQPRQDSASKGAIP